MKKLILLLCIFSLSTSSARAIDIGIAFTRKMEEGVEAYKAEAYDMAAQEFEDALLLRPDSAEAKMNLGLTLARQKEYGSAAATFGEVADMSADNPERLANAYYNHGLCEYDRAEMVFEQEQPDFDKALEIAFDALQSFERAADTLPQFEEAEYNASQTRYLIEEIARKKKAQQEQEQQNQEEQQQEQQQDQQQQDQSSQDQQSREQQSQENQGNNEQDQEQQDQQREENQEGQQEGQQDEQQEDQPPTGRPEDQSGDQQQGQQQNQQQEQNEQQQEQLPDGRPEDRQPQEEQMKQGEKQEQSGAGESAQMYEMSEQEAKNLLNLLGNQELLRFRLPEKQREEFSRKEW